MQKCEKQWKSLETEGRISSEKVRGMFSCASSLGTTFALQFFRKRGGPTVLGDATDTGVPVIECRQFRICVKVGLPRRLSLPASYVSRLKPFQGKRGSDVDML